jgi:hypothetical protein
MAAGKRVRSMAWGLTCQARPAYQFMGNNHRLLGDYRTEQRCLTATGFDFAHSSMS